MISGLSQFSQSIGSLGPDPRVSIEQESFPKIRENPTITQLTQRSNGTLSHGRIGIGQGVPQTQEGPFDFKLGKRFNGGAPAAAFSDGQRLREYGHDRFTRTDFSQRPRGCLFDGRVLVA